MRPRSRLLFAAIATAPVLRQQASPFQQAELSSSISRAVDGLYVREAAEGMRDWTVVLELAKSVTVSVSAVDNSHASNLASSMLAYFLKAFERELRAEFFSDVRIRTEVWFNVVLASEMPDDLRQLANEQFNLDQLLAEQPCVVSRPSSFEVPTPAFVMLSDRFLEELTSPGEVSALQHLFAKSVNELVYQLLNGEVSDEELSPKIAKLVIETLTPAAAARDAPQSS